jgi:ribonuclease P protein component
VAEGSCTFTRGERLKKHAEVRAVLKKGKKVSTGGAKLFYNSRSGIEAQAEAVLKSRFAVVFAKNFGCAVERNRARRLCREAYRHAKAGIPGAWDIVMLIYPSADRQEERTRQLARLLLKSGLSIK